MRLELVKIPVGDSEKATYFYREVCLDLRKNSLWLPTAGLSTRRVRSRYASMSRGWAVAMVHQAATRHPPQCGGRSLGA